MSRCGQCGSTERVEWCQSANAHLCLSCFSGESNVAIAERDAPAPSANGNTPHLREAVAAALEPARVDLLDLIERGIPEREFVPGAPGLPAPNRVLAAAPAGAGKSIATLSQAVASVEAGARWSFLDVENGAAEYARRLEDILKAKPDAEEAVRENLRYFEYPALSLGWDEDELREQFKEDDVVVFDSSRLVLSSVGLSEDSNDDYARFVERMVVPLTRAGTTSLILDNTGHEESGRARGASAKG
jgi:hypothetical protein